MSAKTCSAPRSRNAAATRQSILDAARRQFSRESYESSGVREIAREAGVDPSLICRYFGSKESLFRETLHDPGKASFLEGATAETLPEHLATLVTQPLCSLSAEKIEWLSIVLRSTGSPHAAPVVKEIMETSALRPIRDLLDGENADQRASLVFAILMGAGVLATMRIDTLNRAEDDALHAKIAAIFRAAIS